MTLYKAQSYLHLYFYMLAAIDRQGRAGDETGIVGDEEHDAAGDVICCAQSADRDAFHDLFQNIRRDGADHFCVDIAGRDGINRDADAGAFLGQRLGEAVDAGFGGSVIDLAVLARLTVDRTDIDNATEFAFAHAMDNRVAHVEA